MALLLLLLLEMGCEICIRHARLGSEGYSSLWNWFRSQQETLLSPDSLAALRTYSCGLYPRLVEVSMTLFDLPEAIAVARNALCADAAPQLSRVQMVKELGTVIRGGSGGCCGAYPLTRNACRRGIWRRRWRTTGC